LLAKQERAGCDQTPGSRVNSWLRGRFIGTVSRSFSGARDKNVPSNQFEWSDAGQLEFSSHVQNGHDPREQKAN